MYMSRIESHPRQLIFLGKVTALGVLCCFVLLCVVACLTFACFFVPSVSLINIHMHMEFHVFGTCMSANVTTMYNIHVHLSYRCTMYMYTCTCTCLMRDTEGRKKDASKVK